MKNFVKWFGGFFEDQVGSASSKRAVLYICLFFFYLLIRGSLDGRPVNDNILFTVGGIILFCIGAVTAEFFKQKSE